MPQESKLHNFNIHQFHRKQHRLSRIYATSTNGECRICKTKQQKHGRDKVHQSNYPKFK